jgi:uncharacterized protein YggE
MKGSVRVAALLWAVAVIGLSTPVRAQQEQKTVSVNSTGTVNARPDLCVILVEVRATAPLAEDALQDNAKRVSAILARLKEVGIKESDVKLSGNQFTPAGGGRYVMPGMQRVTGFDVFNVLQVRLPLIEGTAAEAMQSRIAGLLDELIKAGASMLSPDVSRISLGGNSAVVFAVENADRYESQALDAAIERARPVAEQIAKRMGVKITGLESVRTSGQQVVRSPYGSDPLGFSYVSTSPDDVPVRVSAVVNFAYK